MAFVKSTQIEQNRMLQGSTVTIEIELYWFNASLLQLNPAQSFDKNNILTGRFHSISIKNERKKTLSKDLSDFSPMNLEIGRLHRFTFKSSVTYGKESPKTKGQSTSQRTLRTTRIWHLTLGNKKKNQFQSWTKTNSSFSL